MTIRLCLVLGEAVHMSAKLDMVCCLHLHLGCVNEAEGEVFARLEIVPPLWVETFGWLTVESERDRIPEWLCFFSTYKLNISPPMLAKLKSILFPLRLVRRHIVTPRIWLSHSMAKLGVQALGAMQSRRLVI